MPTHTVKYVNGRILTFDSLDAAIRGTNHHIIEKLKYGFLKDWVNPPPDSFRFRFGGYDFGAGDDVIFLDECGLLVPVWRVKEAFANLPCVYEPMGGRWRKTHVKKTDFRTKPVPHTGKYRRGGYRRHIHTRQEICENKFLSCDEDAIEFKIIARNDRKGLPDYRDDIYRDRTKSWKKHRATQWKEHRKA